MRRLLQVRLLFVLLALLLVPALALPFAERLRTEWARYCEPKAKPIDDSQAVADAALALLKELESRNYAQRVAAERARARDIEAYPIPVLQPGCLFRAAPDESAASAVDADDFPPMEAVAKWEAFTRAMEDIELPEFDEFDLQPMLSLPTEEYWAELKAREARRNAAKP